RRYRWRSLKCFRQNREVLIDRFPWLTGWNHRKLHQQARILLHLLLTPFHSFVDSLERGSDKVFIAHHVLICFERSLRRLPRHVLDQLRFAADHFILIGRGPLNRSKRIGYEPVPHNVWRGDDPGCTQRWTPVVAPEHPRSDWISARGQK